VLVTLAEQTRHQVVARDVELDAGLLHGCRRG
jgi:hypothetical protein